MMKRLAILLGLIAFAFCYAPPPPPASAQFSGQAQWARTASTGSANAQSVALANYNLNIGVPVTFIVGAGLTNTDTTTLNINGTGAIIVRRMTNVGIAQLVGGELVATNQATVVYDGTQYRLTGVPYQIGVAAIFRGAVDVGWQIEDGSCFSTLDTKYSPLFSKIGTVYGTCGANSFKVPDTRGLIDAGLDNQGSFGSRGVITVCTFTSPGVTCGAQTSSLTSVNQMPPYTPQGFTSFTPSGNITYNVVRYGGQAPGSLDTGGTIAPINTVQLTGAELDFHGTPISPVLTGTPVGASAPFVVLSPVIGTFRAIKL